jgi:hypothetical protein
MSHLEDVAQLEGCASCSPILNTIRWINGAMTLRYHGMPPSVYVRVFEEEGNCIVCLEKRADELMRHLISGELTNYRVVRTSPEPLQYTVSTSRQHLVPSNTFGTGSSHSLLSTM